MNKLRIAFYKAECGAIDDKIIDFVTGSNGYSHCEVMFSDTTMIGAHFHTKSVEAFHYRNVVDSPKWDVYEFDLPSEPAIELAKKYIGTKYDTLGVVLYALGVKRMASDKGVWCSELVQECINASIRASKDTEMKVSPTLIMPNDQVEMIRKFGILVTNRLAGGQRIQAEMVADYKVDRYGRINYG